MENLTDLKLNITANEMEDSNNFENLNYMLDHFELKNGYLVSQNPNGNFASENNKFIEQYKQCDAASFASNLFANITLAEKDSGNVELRAGYYLKIILGA